MVPATGSLLRLSMLTPSANGADFESADGSASSVIATLGTAAAPGGVNMKTGIPAASRADIERVASPRFCHPSVTITAGPPFAAGFAASALSAFSRLVAPGAHALHPSALPRIAIASLTVVG